MTLTNAKSKELISKIVKLLLLDDRIETIEVLKENRQSMGESYTIKVSLFSGQKTHTLLSTDMLENTNFDPSGAIVGIMFNNMGQYPETINVFAKETK